MKRSLISFLSIFEAALFFWVIPGGVFRVPIIVYPGEKLVIMQDGTVFPKGPLTTDWTLTFNDEFDGTKLDQMKWRTDYWNGGNGELQQYIADDSQGNYQIKDGVLSIIAQKAKDAGKFYNSGVITTQGRFAQQYGFFEIRAKLPAGKGLWPAFWLMPDPSGWPPEIDIMENLGHQPSVIYMTLHSSNPKGQIQARYNGPDFSAGMHTFGVSWQPDSIIWYVDGVEQKRSTDSTKIPNMPMFILANLAVGGLWPGSPDSTTIFPASFEIDYIRAWKKAPPPTSN